MNFLKTNRKEFYMFVIFGNIYLNIEIFFRAIKMYETFGLSLIGYASVYMFFIGGFASYLVGLQNEKFKINIIAQSLIGGFIINFIEYFTGLIFNVILFPDMPLWDYKDMPYNLHGQICLPFGIVWFLLCPCIIKTDDFLRKHIK